MSSYQDFIICPHCEWDFASLYTESYFNTASCILCNWRESKEDDDLYNELWPEAHVDAIDKLGEKATDEEIDELTDKIVNKNMKNYLKNEAWTDYTPTAIDIKISKKIQKDFNSFDSPELHEYVFEFGEINKNTYKEFYKFAIEKILE